MTIVCEFCNKPCEDSVEYQLHLTSDCSNPVDSNSELESMRSKDILAELCAEAPSNDIRDCLRLYCPSKTIRQLTAIFMACNKGPIMDTLNYLGANKNWDNLTKPICTHELICKIQNLLPEECTICKETYAVSRNDPPFLSCSKCGQEVHRSCFLKLLGINHQHSAQSIHELVNPFSLQGIHYLCPSCEEDCIPKCDTGLKKAAGRRVKKAITIEAEIDVSVPTEQTGSEQVTLHTSPENSTCANQESDLNTLSAVEKDTKGSDDPCLLNQTENTSTLPPTPSTQGEPPPPSSSKYVPPEQNPPVKPMCKQFIQGTCEYGMRGKDCPFYHPRYCAKLMKHGTNATRGCTLSNNNCTNFHPKMCLDSLRRSQCFKDECPFFHVKGTKRQQTKKNSPSKNKKEVPPEEDSKNNKNKNNKNKNKNKKNPGELQPSKISHHNQNWDSKKDQQTPDSSFLEVVQLMEAKIMSAMETKLANILQLLKVQQQTNPATTYQHHPPPQGLMPKTVPSTVPFVSDLLHEKNQLFFAMSETWLADHNDAELAIEGYKLYRTDRKHQKKSRGRDSGGVAIYVKDDLATTMEPILSYTNGSTELLCLYSKSENLVLAVIYRKPGGGNVTSSSSQPNSAMKALESAITKLGDPTPDIIFGGDFNLPNCSWPDGNPKVNAGPDERKAISSLQQLSNNLFLKQIVDVPTHKDGNLLDLVFTNNSRLIHSFNATPTLFSTSHHSIIEIATAYKSDVKYEAEVQDKPHSPFDALNFMHDDINWQSIIDSLADHTWQNEFDGLSSEEEFNHLLDISLKISENHAPERKSFASKSVNSSIPRERKNLMRRRGRVNKQISKTTSSAKLSRLRKELINIEKSLQNSYKTSTQISESKALQAITKNPKYFYSYAKKFSKIKSKVGPLLNEDEEYVSNSKDMANILADQFISVFTKPKEALPDSFSIFPDNDENCILNDLIFSEDDVLEAIDEIPLTAASGPDGFPSIFLKKCKEVITKPLYMMMRRWLDESTTINELKLSHIMPIFKSGSMAVAANYRAIALTSQIIKIFEKIVRKKVVKYMEENNLFNHTQHGFRLGRSCLSELLTHFDNVLTLIEQGKNVDVIYLDFAKAFDKVDFSILLRKLKDLGIGGKLGRWIFSFLTDREQIVIVNGQSSKPAKVTSGVPQGSVLGPLLFLILMGDIDKDLAHSVLLSFADDTRLTKGVSGVVEASQLQTDLNIVYEWAETNNMSFNNTKFEALRYGSDTTLKACTNYCSSTGEIISDKQVIKDVGVLMSNNCSFQAHINSVIGKAKNVSSWILRTFASRAPLLMLTCWKAYALPILDYCSQLWSPTKPGPIQELEKIQKSYVRKIWGASSDYWLNLNKFRLYSLERRRERYLIIYTWKILENQVPNVGSGEGRIRGYESPRHGRRCYIPIINHRILPSLRTIRDSSFTIRGPMLFNDALPKQIRNLKECDLPTFKRKLDAFLSTVPDEPLITGYTGYRRAESNSLQHMARYAGEDLAHGRGSPDSR